MAEEAGVNLKNGISMKAETGGNELGNSKILPTQVRILLLSQLKYYESEGSYKYL